MPSEPPDRPTLVVRDGSRIVEAPREDQDVAAQYPAYPDKGAVVDGYRLTILSRQGAYGVGDPVRVVHVCEAVAQGTKLYVMGPKPVYAEYVDGEHATAAVPPGENALAPSAYDGRVVDGPAVDYNYEITEYRFATPGTHTIQWRPKPYASNVLRIEVAPDRRPA